MARTKKVKNELEIVESSKVNEIFPPMDEEKLKDELKDYVNVLVKKSFEEEYEKANKRLIREKSRKIFFKNIIILFLLIIIGFLLYLLFSNGYFKKYISINSIQDEIVQKDDVKTVEKEEKDNKPSQDELKAKYSYLLDKYVISEKSSYLIDYYSGNLTNDLKKYLVLNTIDFNSLNKEDDINIIDEITFKEAYTKMFNDNLINNTFDYNGNKVRYISSMQAYLTTNVLEKDNTSIKREIKSIEVKDDTIYITTVENVTINSENKNIDANELLNDKIETIQMIYTFKTEKLIDMSRIN